MGLGIFMPMNSCGYGLGLSDYRQVAFAEDTRWDEFVELFVDRYDGRSVADDANSGYGHVVLRLGDRTYETNCIYCSLSPDDLELFDIEMEEWCVEKVAQPMFDPDFPYLTMEFTNDGRTITKAYFWERVSEDDNRSEPPDMTVVVSNHDSIPGLFYRGEVEFDIMNLVTPGGVCFVRVLSVPFLWVLLRGCSHFYLR